MKTTTTLFLILFSLVITQSQTIEWQNSYSGDEVDILTGILRVDNSGYLLYGRSRSNAFADKSEDSYGDFDYWIVRIDGEGEKIWDRTFGGAERDMLEFVDRTTDGGFILGGHSGSGVSGNKTTPNEGQFDYWIVKISENGDFLWDKNYGGSGIDELQKVLVTSDGGFVLAGFSDSNMSGDKTEDSRGSRDYWILKLNSLGEEEWQKTIGGDGGELLYQVIETNDGGYLLSGSSDSNISGEKTELSKGGSDYWIVKIDQLGAIVWQKTIGGDQGDVPENLLEIGSDQYLIGGYSFSNQSGDKSESSNGELDYWIVAIDSNGDVLWQNTIGSSSFDILYTMSEAPDGGFYLGGSSNSEVGGDKTENSRGGLDMWLVKINAQGGVEWDKTYGGSLNDDMSSVVAINENQVIIGGPSRSGVSGDKTEESEGYWLLQLTDIPTEINEYASSCCLEVFPNPTDDFIFIKLDNDMPLSGRLAIFDISGRIIYSDESYDSSKSVDLRSFIPGTYFLEVSIEEFTYQGKVVIK